MEGLEQRWPESDLVAQWARPAVPVRRSGDGRELLGYWRHVRGGKTPRVGGKGWRDGVRHLYGWQALGGAGAGGLSRRSQNRARSGADSESVSYTHLTLPTIYSV